MSDSTSKRLEDHPTHSNADRSQTEIAALVTVTGLSGDKANEYYHQVLGARGAKPADNLVDGDENDWHADDFYDSSATNLGNTKIARSGRKPKGSSGKNVEPIQVFEKGKDPKAFDDAKKAMADSPSTEVTALQVEMSPDDIVKAQMNRSGTAGGNRSFSDSDTGVVYAARPEALEEELSHQLNPADTRKTTAENKRADKAQADALARAKRLGLGRDEAYYVFGKRGERVNAMAMAKHVVMRAKKDLVPLLAEQGEGAVDAFVAEVEREMRADGRPDDIKPVLAVIRAYVKLSQMKPSEMTPEQREAWKDLSDASVWDQVAKAKKNRGPSADKEVMADIGGGTSDEKMTEGLQRRAGAAGEVADAGIAWLERQAKKTADMDVPVLSGAAKALQPLYAGARAVIAHATSGGGKYYQPEVRDERYFSNDALRLMAKNLARHGGRSMSRYDYGKPSPATWEASQAVGGATVKDGKITDVFDVDTKDPYGLSDGARLVNGGFGAAVDLGHRALGLVFGDERDPAAGKVRTEIPLDAIRRAEVRQDAKGGDAGDEVTENTEIVNSGEAADTPVTNGPRIVVNPKVFRDSRDALCVAYNEAYRVAMEGLGFDPVSEPTGEQRRFFADTAYADDERMMRRTILARICTFDTSVKNPTDEQIQESVEFLETVLEAGFPQNEREQSVVKRTLDVLRSVPQGRGDAVPAEEGAPEEGVPGEAGASGDGAPLDEPPG